MGIQVETTVYGPQLGRELAADPEEFGYALAEMTESSAEKLGSEVAESLPYGQDAEIVKWLRDLASAIEVGAAS